MALVVEQLSLGPLGTNCYVVLAERGATDAVVVDPSGPAPEILARLGELGASCAAILVTHGHFDHILGVAELAESTGAPVYMPVGDRALLETPTEVWGVLVQAWAPDVLVEGGETVEAAGISFEALDVPGHSPGHISYYADGSLFSGDVLFAGSVGRTDLPGADWDTLLASIRLLAGSYPPDTAVYPGHGAPTTLGGELERNPFLAELRTP